MRELLKSGSINEPTLVITFDDGYEDNFVNLRAVSEETRGSRRALPINGHGDKSSGIYARL